MIAHSVNGEPRMGSLLVIRCSGSGGVAERIEDRLEIGRERRVKLARLAPAGESDAQPAGMQEVTLDGNGWLLPAIDPVANDRAAQKGAMHANLVRATGQRVKFQ